VVIPGKLSEQTVFTLFKKSSSMWEESLYIFKFLGIPECYRPCCFLLYDKSGLTQPIPKQKPGKKLPSHPRKANGAHPVRQSKKGK